LPLRKELRQAIEEFPGAIDSSTEFTVMKGSTSWALQDWQCCMRRPRKRTVLTSSIDRQPSGAAMGFLRKEAVQKWGVSERWDNKKNLIDLLSFETDCKLTLS